MNRWPTLHLPPDLSHAWREKAAVAREAQLQEIRALMEQRERAKAIAVDAAPLKNSNSSLKQPRSAEASCRRSFGYQRLGSLASCDYDPLQEAQQELEVLNNRELQHVR